MRKRTLFWAMGPLLLIACLTLWAQQTVARITLIGYIGFTSKQQATDGILTASEDGTLGGSRGDQIRCSISQECFALGLLNGNETVFVANAGSVTSVQLQKAQNESNSQAFSVSQNGKYWWTTNRGVIRRKPNTLAALEYAPDTAKITAYRRDGTIQQQWQLRDSEAVSRMERLGDDSVIVQSSGKLYRYQLGHPKRKFYPHGDLFNPSAIIGGDGFIWSPGQRAADDSISLLGISIFAPATSKPVEIDYPSRKFWIAPIEGSQKQGVYIGDGGTLRKMQVDLLSLDGSVKNVVRISRGQVAGFEPTAGADYIWNYLGAGKNYALVATKIKDKSGRGLEHFILKITPIPRWKTWFAQTP